MPEEEKKETSIEFTRTESFNLLINGEVYNSVEGVTVPIAQDDLSSSVEDRLVLETTNWLNSSYKFIRNKETFNFAVVSGVVAGLAVFSSNEVYQSDSNLAKVAYGVGALVSGILAFGGVVGGVQEARRGELPELRRIQDKIDAVKESKTKTTVDK